MKNIPSNIYFLLQGARGIHPSLRAGSLLSGILTRKLSHHLTETTCLIADVHMPAMSGIELHSHLADTGYAIPTILITAPPNAADRSRSGDAVLPATGSFP